MGKYLIKVNMKLILVCLVTLVLLILTNIVNAQDENPLIPYIDSGEGYGVNPGDKKSFPQKIMDILFETGEINTQPAPIAPTATPTNIPTLDPDKPTTAPQINTPTISSGSTEITDTTQIPGCPAGNSKLLVSGKYQHLNQQFECNPPRMIVVHWSGSWSSAQATFNVLNDRERSCQFAIDDRETLQMLDFYNAEVQHGWCVGGDYNTGSISLEITGAYFDDVLNNPGTGNYSRLMKETDTSILLTCKLIEMYRIPETAIYGHYELNSGKSDPGPEYLQYFKNRVQNEC